MIFFHNRYFNKRIFNEKTFIYDKNGEEDYKIISAIHKALRNSDNDVCLYWFARMLETGEEPLYVKNNY